MNHHLWFYVVVRQTVFYLCFQNKNQTSWINENHCQRWNSMHEMCFDDEELTTLTKETQRRLTIRLNGCDREFICPFLCICYLLFFLHSWRWKKIHTYTLYYTYIYLHISSLLILVLFSFSIVLLFSRLYSHILDFTSVHYCIDGIKQQPKKRSRQHSMSLKRLFAALN